MLNKCASMLTFIENMGGGQKPPLPISKILTCLQQGAAPQTGEAPEAAYEKVTILNVSAAFRTAETLVPREHLLMPTIIMKVLFQVAAIGRKTVKGDVMGLLIGRIKSTLPELLIIKTNPTCINTTLKYGHTGQG